MTYTNPYLDHNEYSVNIYDLLGFHVNDKVYIQSMLYISLLNST